MIFHNICNKINRVDFILIRKIAVSYWYVNGGNMQKIVKGDISDRKRIKRISNSNKPGLSIVKTSLLMGAIMFIAFTFLMVNFVSYL